MSSAAGPMVPVRTGSWLLRPVAPSLSSNVVSVLALISTAAFSVWVLPTRALRARRWERGQSYMVRAPNQGAVYSPVEAGRAVLVAWVRRGGGCVAHAR